MSERARVLLFTGDGKGKTTAAMGMLLRAAGHGMAACLVQFVKASRSGELAALERLGVTIVRNGLGFVPAESDPKFELHRQAAGKTLALAEDVLASGRFDLVVLDEICLAVARRLIDEQRVVELVARARPGSAVALTGRGATAGLIALADTVTEMRCVKHALQQGIAAQAGVEQ